MYFKPTTVKQFLIAMVKGSTDRPSKSGNKMVTDLIHKYSPFTDPYF